MIGFDGFPSTWSTFLERIYLGSAPPCTAHSSNFDVLGCSSPIFGSIYTEDGRGAGKGWGTQPSARVRWDSSARGREDVIWLGIDLVARGGAPAVVVVVVAVGAVVEVRERRGERRGERVRQGRGGGVDDPIGERVVQVRYLSQKTAMLTGFVNLISASQAVKSRSDEQGLSHTMLYIDL